MVYAGIYQYDEIPVASPSFAASFPSIAAVVGTGQKESPKQEDRICRALGLPRPVVLLTLTYEDDEPCLPGH